MGVDRRQGRSGRGGGAQSKKEHGGDQSASFELAFMALTRFSLSRMAYGHVDAPYLEHYTPYGKLTLLRFVRLVKEG